MLELHAAAVSEINARSARIHWAFETAVSSDERLAEIWARLTEAQLVGMRWSAEVLLRKPGVRADLTLREAEATLLTATDWNTYRTLTTKLRMTAEEGSVTVPSTGIDACGPRPAKRSSWWPERKRIWIQRKM